MPLSPQAVACLRRLEVRAGGVDLPDTRPGRLPVGPRRPRATDYCPIPSLFLDWAAEQTGYRYEIKEALSTIRWGTTCDDAMNGRVGLTSGGPCFVTGPPGATGRSASLPTTSCRCGRKYLPKLAFRTL